MIRGTIAVAAVMTTIAAAVFACSSSSSGGGGGGGSSWAGTYNCTQTTNVDMIMLGDASIGNMDGTKAMGTLTVTQNGNDLTAVVTSDAGSACTLNFTANGDTATVASGQSCMGMQQGFTYTESFTSGTATLSGTTVTTNLAGKVTGQVMATFTEMATCTKSM